MTSRPTLPRTTTRRPGARPVRSVVAAAVLALVAASAAPGTAAPDSPRETPGAAARAYTVTPGPSFGTPGGYQHEKLMLAHLAQAPAGSVVRATTWSFTSQTMAQALVTAARRGVKIRLITSYRARKEDAFATVKAGFRGVKGSRIKAAKFSARGKDRINGKATGFHQKSFTFSQVGSTRDVSVISSANLTSGAGAYQYTDTYTFVENPKVRKKMNEIFAQQWQDKALAKPFVQWGPKKGGTVELTFGPWNKPDMADPVLARLNAVPAAPGTVVRVANSALHDHRSEYLARRLVAIRRGGGEVHVLSSLPFAKGVRKILKQGGVKILRGAVPAGPGEAGSTHYHHHKFMTAKYRSGGRIVHRTWMGSENWTLDSRFSDELVVRVAAAQTHLAYVTQFNRVAEGVAAEIARRKHPTT